MSEKQIEHVATGGGVSLATVLLVIFLVLKLTGLVDWSWLWVLSPLWIPIALTVSILFIIGVVALFVLLFFQ
jgi:hypothetical protein